MKAKYNDDIYAKFAASSFSFNYLETPTIKKFLLGQPYKKLKLIEAGCGEGRVTKLLVSLGIQEKNIIGIDISSYLLDIARKKFPQVKWFHNSIGDQVKDIKSGETDVLVCSMVLDYLNNKSFESFLENSSRWLKPKGQMLIIIPNPIRMLLDKLDTYFDRRKTVNMAPWGDIVPYNHRTIGDYINAVIKHGFEIKAVVEPEPPKRSAKVNSEGYKKYRMCPTRLAIWAVKK